MLQLYSFDAVPILPLLSALFLCIVYIQKRRTRFPYAPGPKPLPIIGNLRDLPTENQSATYLKWAKQYGELVHVNVLGNHMLFVNSTQAVKDLFDNRSLNYSDRNHLHMINDLMGWDWSFGMMSYGPRWANHRKMFHRQFKASEVHNFFPIQVQQAQALLRRLLEDQDKFVGHLRHNAAATIMKIVYGMDIAHKYEDDRYVSVAEEALFAMAVAARPGAFMVDMLPFLKYVPAWVPGAGFQRKAATWKKITYEMRDAPFDAVLSAMSAGTVSPSFVSSLMAEVDSFANESPDVSKAEQIETIKGCAGLAYAAGAESMVSSLSSWFLAMVLHPKVQQRAQAQLDKVLKGRLPTFEDRPDLPYIEAMVTETLRWSPVAPLGLPHMATKDDHYNGYFIPAGTTVAGNSWAILHDPETYPEPLIFSPDRFLPDPKTGKPSSAPFPECAFGYGRRICPGRHMTNNSLFITMACVLTCFNIKPLAGAPAPTAKFTDGMISHPLPFKCSIEPRSKKALGLILQSD